MVSGVRLLSARVPSSLGIHPETFDTMWWDIPEEFRTVEELKESLSLWFTPEVRDRIVQPIIVDHKSRVGPTGVKPACSPACEMRGEAAWSFTSGTDEHVDWAAVRRRVSGEVDGVAGGAIDVDSANATPSSKKHKNRKKKRKDTAAADDDGAVGGGAPTEENVVSCTTTSLPTTPSTPCANATVKPYHPLTLDSSDKDWHNGRGFLQGINNVTLNPVWQCDLTPIPVDEIQRRIIGLFRRPAGYMIVPGEKVPTMRFVEDMQKGLMDPHGPAAPRCSGTCDRPPERYFYTTASTHPLPIGEVMRLRDEVRDLANEHTMLSYCDRVRPSLAPGESRELRFGWDPMPSYTLPAGSDGDSTRYGLNSATPQQGDRDDDSLVTRTLSMFVTGGLRADDVDEGTALTARKKKKQKKKKTKKRTSNVAPAPAGLEEGERAGQDVEDDEAMAPVTGDMSTRSANVHRLADQTSEGSSPKAIQSLPCWNALVPRFEANILPGDREHAPGVLLGLNDRLEPAWYYDISDMASNQLKINLDRYFSGRGQLSFTTAITMDLTDNYGSAPTTCSWRCNRGNCDGQKPFFYTTVSLHAPDKQQLDRLIALNSSRSVDPVAEMVVDFTMRMGVPIDNPQEAARAISERAQSSSSRFRTFHPPGGPSSSGADAPRVEDLSDSWMNNSDEDKVRTATKKNRKKKSKGKGKQKEFKSHPEPRSDDVDSPPRDVSVLDDGSTHADDEMDAADLFRLATPSTAVPEAENPTRLTVLGRKQTCFCEECMNPPARYARLDDTDLEDD
ncbi:uncharacterized protein LOC62_07G009470 [Vanrija pseudolonga]|uniref:Uncharacterized protein n=1 Tax=Vanrija pseudolonga TaxID=143232 RepID=A0AAF0YHY5_9TREE|nr:hypothetical protein LOC62_07G009470 [Vanrija pseudolonga]